jgi:hypothetical protein
LQYNSENVCYMQVINWSFCYGDKVTDDNYVMGTYTNEEGKKWIRNSGEETWTKQPTGTREDSMKMDGDEMHCEGQDGRDWLTTDCAAIEGL